MRPHESCCWKFLPSPPRSSKAVARHGMRSHQTSKGAPGTSDHAWVVYGCHQVCPSTPKLKEGGLGGVCVWGGVSLYPHSTAMGHLQVWGCAKAFPKELAKGDSRFKDFPRGQRVLPREQQAGCGQAADSLPSPVPPALCSGRCLQRRSRAMAVISWVFHTLPCQGRVEVGGRGQEVQGAGRGNQLHESPEQPATDGQDTHRKHHFPWIRCRGEAGTSPQAQVVPGSAGCRGQAQAAELSGERGRALLYHRS